MATGPPSGTGWSLAHTQRGVAAGVVKGVANPYWEGPSPWGDSIYPQLGRVRLVPCPRQVSLRATQRRGERPSSGGSYRASANTRSLPQVPARR